VGSGGATRDNTLSTGTGNLSLQGGSLFVGGGFSGVLQGDSGNNSVTVSNLILGGSSAAIDVGGAAGTGNNTVTVTHTLTLGASSGTNDAIYVGGSGGSGQNSLGAAAISLA